jgi:hypothetical protein
MSTLQGFAQSFPGGTSQTYTTPFPVALGTKARDARGNEYVFCVTGGATSAPEMVVVVGADYTITPIGAAGAVGTIGVVVDYAKQGLTSALVSGYPTGTGLWVQIYGRAYIMYGGGGTSPSENLLTTVRTSLAIRFHVATSTASTPVGQPRPTSLADNVVSLSDFLIHGMYVATDATPDASGASVMRDDGTTLGLGVTAVSATHSGATIAVWLNYPYASYIPPGTSV